MAAYRRVYDSRHLQADCQEPGSALEPSLGNRVWLPLPYLLQSFAAQPSQINRVPWTY